MAGQPITHTLEIEEAQAFLVDPSANDIIQITVRTKTDWYHLRISRVELRTLSRQIERLLHDEPPEPPQGS
jgi:hypothetical protein